MFQLLASLSRPALALLAWIGGVGSTIGGSWISTKIHVYHECRRAHLQDIRDKVLRPLRDGLEQHFAPVVSGQVPAVSVEHDAKDFNPNAKVTEEPLTAGPLLIAAFPSSLIFGPLEQALLQDARTRHFRPLMTVIDQVMTEWARHAGECHAWVAQLSAEILNESRLPAFPSRHPRGPHVMHQRLGAFVYHRLFRFSTGALAPESNGSWWYLRGSSGTLAFAETVAQIDALISILDRLVTAGQDRAAQLQARAATLHQKYLNALADLNLAIANERLHGRCDLVSFF